MNHCPRYLLSNGIVVDFMCMSKDNMELYHTLHKQKLLYDRQIKRGGMVTIKNTQSELTRF
jgi:hypothetical protein